MSSARDYALFQLDRKELPNWKSRSFPHRVNVAEPSDPRDRALAEQIEVGVVKNLLELQHLTERLAGRPLGKIHPLLQKIIAVAIFQVRHLDRIPASAAVDEAVEQTKRLGLGHARGFANAVLRAAVREGKVELTEISEPAERAEMVYSHPAELYHRMEALLGEAGAMELCRQDNAEPPTILRLIGEHTLEEVRVAAGEMGAIFTEHVTEGMIVAANPGRAILAELSRAGLAQVQDPTAAKVLRSAGLSAGMSFLDRCCGMGTKTLQALEYLGAQGTVVAMDPSAARCEGLRRMLVARKVENVRVIQAGAFPTGNPEVPQEYDVALADVPCSNSGVMSRRAEARYHQTAKELEELGRLQLEILRDTADCVRPGGSLIYSTCSIWAKENEAVVAEFVRSRRDYSVMREETTLPQSPSAREHHDGGYFAVLRRKGDRPAK